MGLPKEQKLLLLVRVRLRGGKGREHAEGFGEHFHVLFADFLELGGNLTKAAKGSHTEHFLHFFLIA